MLFDIVIWIIVGIFVADSLAEFFMTTVVSILQMDRNSCLCVFHRIHGGKNGIDSGITLWSTGHISDCLRKDDL